jgi:hypothetical protein
MELPGNHGTWSGTSSFVVWSCPARIRRCQSPTLPDDGQRLLSSSLPPRKSRNPGAMQPYRKDTVVVARIRCLKILSARKSEGGTFPE